MYPLLRMACIALPTLWLSACGDSPFSGSATGTPPPALPSAVAFAPTPETDPFYDPVLADPTLAPGTLLNSRPINFQVSAFRFNNPAWTLKFVTRNGHGQPMVGFATVLLPTEPPPGEPRLVSYQIAYNGLGGRCTPSRNLSGNSPGVVPNPAFLSSLYNYQLGFNTLGWTMVFPDFEGPYHAYTAGTLSGQVTLDAIRAALAFAPLGLKATTPVGLWGYSGGALATSWAAALHADYAPELNLVAGVSGGTPTDLLAAYRGASGGPFFGLIFTAMLGVNREYPEFLTGYLNERGLSTAEAVKDACVGMGEDGSAARGSMDEFTIAPNFFDEPHVQALNNRISLPQGAKGEPTFPMLVYHEILDDLLPIAGADRMVQAWCERGAPVTYLRSLTGDHNTGGLTFVVEGTSFLQSQFNGSAFITTRQAERCNLQQAP